MKTRLAILLFFWSFAIQAQQVTTVEYFFDTDPGFGNGSQLPVNSLTLDSTFDFSIAALPAGLHTLFVRLKNSDDKWSTLYQDNVLIVTGTAGATQIIKAEYFYDTDPGFGNGLSINLSNTTLDSTLNFSVDGLTPGAHSLFVRLQNSNNNWGATYQSDFLVWPGSSGTPQIQTLLYFVDTVANTVQIPLNLTAALDTTVSVQIPDNGADSRKLGLRLKNQTGEFGNATITDISLCDLYKPQGGFRTAQFGNTFTLIDTTKYNDLFKVKWFADNVLLDTSYMTNYTFPPNFIGSKDILQLTGTGCRVDSVMKIIAMAGIESSAPSIGSYNSDFNLNIYGGGLDTTTIVYMQKGDTLIYPYLKFVASNKQLIAVFDFHMYPKIISTNSLDGGDKFDDYTLHVIFANGYHYSGANIAMQKQEGFNGPQLVNDPRRPLRQYNAEPYFATALTGNTNMRVGPWNELTFSITNRGSVVAKEIPFHILVPAHFDIDTTKWKILTNDPTWRDSISIIVPVDTIINGQHLQLKLLSLILPILGPGETKTVPLRLRTTVSDNFEIAFAASKRIYGSAMIAVFPPCFTATFDLLVGFVPVLGCLNGAYDLALQVGQAGVQTQNYIYGMKSDFTPLASMPVNAVGTIVSCVPLGAAFAKNKAAKEFTEGIVFNSQNIANAYHGGVLQAGALVTNTATGPHPCDQIAQDNWNTQSILTRLSFDPNSITGNRDYDTVNNYINNYAPQSYTINFQNKPTATANAQHVYITDSLNSQKFINRTLIISKFSIGDSSYVVPFFRSRLTKDVGLKNRTDLKVRFTADFDTATGVLRTDFFSIDTFGHALPLSSLDGFLPPDTDSLSGTGSVSYSIFAKNLNTLDTFSNKAAIYFDANAPIMTNTWVNTVDTTPPNARIINAIRVNDTTAKLVIQQSDIGSGVWFNTLYAKKTTDTVFLEIGTVSGDTITFIGLQNQTYQLFVKSTDNVNNVQKKDSVADIALTFSNTLPLTMLSFTGRLINDKVQLRWITANEINTSRFDIEKSTNGTAFTRIGTVGARGNTGQNNEYIAYDDHPADGYNYYRLKQFDIDGHFSNSSIVRIYYGKNGYVMIAPNPASDYVTVRSNEKFISIQLIDGTGRVVKSFTPLANDKYSLSGASRGLYYLRLTSNTGVQTFKLLIE